jgi:hypothetical protein
MIIPALTPVSVTILATLGSKLSKTGDMFPIRLAAPISVDGRELVPAGATGMGEVVFAKKSGGSGVGGELVLAARYLEVRGYNLGLRSMPVSAVGKDQIGMALAASEAIGFLGFAITGKNTEIPEGTIASAKTAETFTLAVENSVSSTSSVSQPGEVK